MRTWLQAQSNSSAIIMGSDVLMPWPISGFFETMVTMPSGAIDTNADRMAGAASRAQTGSGMIASRASPPPATTAVFRRVRRLIASGNMIGILMQTRGHLDRGLNPVVAGTATDVAGHGRVDLVHRRPRCVGQQRGRRHNLARLTIAALHD